MPNYIQELHELNPGNEHLRPEEMLKRVWESEGKQESLEDFYKKPAVSSALQDEYLRLQSPDLNPVQDFARGVKRGVIKNTAGTFAEIANFAARNVGWDGAEELSQSALDSLEELYQSPDLRQSYEAATGDWKNLNHLFSAVGEGGTSVAAIVGSGGAGALVKGGLKTLAKKQVGNQIKKATFKKSLLNTAADFAPGYQASSMMAGSALMAGEQAGDIRQYEARTGEDVDPLTEFGTVLPNAIIGGWLESFMPMMMVNKPLSALAKHRLGKEVASELTEKGFQNWARKTGKGIGTGMAGEFTTEYAQSVLSNSLAKAGYDVDRDVLEGAFESGLVGAIIGGGMGGTSSGASAYIDGLDQMMKEEVPNTPAGEIATDIPLTSISETAQATAVAPVFEGPLEKTASAVESTLTPEQELENDVIQRASLQPQTDEEQLLADIVDDEAYQDLIQREETIQQAEAEQAPEQYGKGKLLGDVVASPHETLHSPQAPELSEQLPQKFTDSIDGIKTIPALNQRLNFFRNDKKEGAQEKADYIQSKIDQMKSGKTKETQVAKKKVETKSEAETKTRQEETIAEGQPTKMIGALHTTEDVLAHFDGIKSINKIKNKPLRNRLYKLLTDKGIQTETQYKKARAGLTNHKFTPTKDDVRILPKDSNVELLDKKWKFARTAAAYIKNSKTLSSESEVVYDGKDFKIIPVEKAEVKTVKPLDKKIYGVVSAARKVWSSLFKHSQEEVTDSASIINVDPIIRQIISKSGKEINLTHDDQDSKGGLGVTDIVGSLTGVNEFFSNNEESAEVSSLTDELIYQEEESYGRAIKAFRELEEEIELALANGSLSATQIMNTLKGKSLNQQTTETEKELNELERVVKEVDDLLVDFGTKSPEQIKEYVQAQADKIIAKNNARKGKGKIVTPGFDYKILTATKENLIAEINKALAFRVQAKARIDDLLDSEVSSAGTMSYLLYGETGRALKKYISARVSGKTSMSLPQIRGLQTVTTQFGRSISLGKKQKLSGIQLAYAKRNADHWLENPEFLATQRAKFAILEFSNPNHKFESFEEFARVEAESLAAEATDEISRNWHFPAPQKMLFPAGAPKNLESVSNQIIENRNTISKLMFKGSDLTSGESESWDSAVKQLEALDIQHSELVDKMIADAKIDEESIETYLGSFELRRVAELRQSAGLKPAVSLPYTGADLESQSIRDIESWLDSLQNTNVNTHRSSRYESAPLEDSSNLIEDQYLSPMISRIAKALKLTKTQKRRFKSPFNVLEVAAAAGLKSASNLTTLEKEALQIVKQKIPGMKNALLTIQGELLQGKIAEESRDIKAGEVSNATVFFDKLNQKIADGTNARELLESLGDGLENFPASQKLLEILKSLLGNVNQSELDSIRVEQGPVGTKAGYKDGTITIPTNTTNLYEITHEVLHGLTAKKIFGNSEGTAELKRVYELAKLNSLTFKNPIAGALYSLNQKDDLVGLAEFAAEVYINPELQKFLKTIKDPNQPQKSLWEKFVSAIHRMLGFKPDDTLLTSAINAVTGVVKDSPVEAETGVLSAPTEVPASQSFPAELTDSELIVASLVKRYGVTKEEVMAMMSDPLISEKANSMAIYEVAMETEQETAGTRLSQDGQKLVDGAVAQTEENTRKKTEREKYNKEHYRDPIREVLSDQINYHNKKWYSKLATNLNSWTLTMHNMIDVMTGFAETSAKEMKELFVRRVSDSENSKLKFIQARDKNLSNILKKYGFDREAMETETVVSRDGFRNSATGEWIEAKETKLWNALMLYATRNNPEFQGKLAELSPNRKLKNIKAEAKYLSENLSKGHKFLADVMQKDLAKQSRMISQKISELEDVYVLKNDQEIPKKVQDELERVLEGYGYFKNSVNYMPILGRKIASSEDMLGDVAQVLQIAPEGRKRIKKEVETSQGINQNLYHVWSHTTRNQAHFLGYADVINDMWDVMRGGPDKSRLDNLIYQKFGAQTLESMEAYIHSIAKPQEHTAKDGVSYIATKVRGAAALSFLGWNLMTMAKQVPSFAYFFGKVNPSFMLRTTQQYLTKDGRKAIAEFVKKDPQMYDRQIEQVLDELDSMDSGMFEKLLGKGLQKIPGLEPGTATKIKKKTFRSLMMGIRAADEVVTSIGYYAAFQQYTKEGASEEEARFKALQVVVTSQPASNVKDIGRLWRHSSVTSTFLMFTNQLGKIYNMGMHDVLLKGVATKGFDKDMARTSVALAVGALGIGVIGHGFRWEDDDEETGFIREGVDMIIGGGIATIPLFGGSLSAAWSGYPSPSDLVRSVPHNALRAVIQGAHGEFSKATKSMMRATLVPGQAQMLRVWQAFDSDTPEYGLTRLAGAKRVFDSEESLIPIIEQYKKSLSFERTHPVEFRKVMVEVRKYKRMAANAGKAGKPGEAAKYRRKATELKSSITSSKWKNKIEALTKKWSLDKRKVQELVRSL